MSTDKHRWNFEATDDSLQVCRDQHDKGQPCEYENLSPYESLKIINELRADLFAKNNENKQLQARSEYAEENAKQQRELKRKAREQRNAAQARCAEQDGIIERLRETITIRGQRLAVLSGDNVRLESEKAELEAKVEDLEAELIFENNTTKMQKKLVQQLEAEKARQQDRIATLREGLNQAIELLVTALHEPEQITEGEIHDLRTMEIEAREPTPHPAESENSNG